jgi:hypothetical protein
MNPRLVWLLLILSVPARSTAQTPPPPLSFLGFEPGARLEAVGQQVLALGGRGLRCDRARRDPTVNDCRATVFDPVSGRPVSVWLSAMDSAAGVLTISSPVTAEQLDDWKTELEAAFGVVGARVEGPQWMLQWVRRGRMLRLTWRIENRQKVASVSLVDGGVLDGWGNRRFKAPATDSPRAAPVAPPSPSPIRPDSASSR